MNGIDDKLKRRRSYGRAQVKPPTLGRLAVSEGIQKEHSEKGRVKGSVYRRYIEASSESGFAIFIAAIVLSQACSILSNFALRFWSEDNRRTGDNGGMTKYLALSGIVQLLSVVFLTIATVSLLLLCALRSSKQLHDSVSDILMSPMHRWIVILIRGSAQMLNSLIHAPLSFFEQTPTGRYVLALALLGESRI